MSRQRLPGAALLALGAAGCAAAPVLPLPGRPANAATGSALVAELQALPLRDREARLEREFVAGNVPSFLRRLVPVRTTATVGGRQRTAVFFVTSDYLGVGSETDWLRTPLSPPVAQRLADRWHAALPTRRLVDAIQTAATVRVEPATFHPQQHDITAFGLFAAHHRRIESARGGTDRAALLAGAKKDVVVSALLADWPGRVCIYGWHRRSGAAIQPLSKVHTFPHVDYSHGVRLVHRQVLVDGEPWDYAALLADPALHVLASDEGPFASWRYPTGP